MIERERVIGALGGLMLVMSSLLGCEDTSAALIVDLRTDLSPINEFDSVRTELSRAPFTADEDVELADEALALPSADYVTGHRVAELSTRPGPAFVRVSLIDRMGRVVVSRVSSVNVQRRMAVVVVVSRTCRGVVCPDPGGDPQRTSCVAGRCELPSCTPETPETCSTAPECDTSADCAPATALCASSVCADGECFEIGDHARCAADEWCNPDEGCVLRAGLERDAGPGCPATETSCADGVDEDCDDLLDCADPDCGGQRCDDGNACTENDVCGGDGGTCAGAAIACDDDNTCTDDACDPSTGACSFAPNAAPCDDGLFCNGADTCAGGACGMHAGSPCTQFCSESTRACTQCETAADCGTAPPTTWGACGYSDNCDETATQTGTQTTIACDAGMCTTTVTNPTRSCTRETDGTRPAGCNGTTYGAWPTSCTAGFADTCDTTGTQSRTVDTQSCRTGACGSTRTSESRGCTRSSRDGVQCGAGTRNRCCSGSCVDIWSSEAHCGGCGEACASGLSCTIVSQGAVGAACYRCTFNSQCEGGNTSLETCYAVSVGGRGYCRCQSDAGCAPGQRCFNGMAGDSYCYYP